MHLHIYYSLPLQTFKSLGAAGELERYRVFAAFEKVECTRLFGDFR